ncbi:MAG TPA: hypothetical protein VFQ22_04730, partial [Longimicrobiales bacterium]|nr:hypothetical protein [Longimicrobiales bacterium]
MVDDARPVSRQPEGFAALASRLERRFAAGVRAPWTEEEFEQHARAAFTLQFHSVPPFRALCEARGVTPASVRSWREVPAVPAAAFKHLDLICEGETPEAVFLTSGTTRGAGSRGRHLVPRLSLYRSALLPPFVEHVMAARGRIRFVSLIPSPEERPDSSLSWMVGAAAATLATTAHWLVDGQGALDAERLRTLLRRAANAGEPILLLGTALALLHVLVDLEAVPVPPLPPGTRIMETGGFKGAGREVTRGELYERLAYATGVPRERIVSEYGMTELLSQLYEPVLSEGPGAAGTHVPPPWLRVRALDPDTLEELPDGIDGLLAFYDLANL